MRWTACMVVSILLGFVMLATCIPAWMFALAEDGVTRIRDWRDEP